MSNDQLDSQVVELDDLHEQREIVTFMRRSSPLNTSQRTALEQYGHLILEYPVGDLRQHFEHPERPLTVEIGFGMGRSLVLMAKANPERNFKRRFVSHDRMPLIEEKLEMGGTFHAATDWEPYAEWMIDVLDNRPRLENVAGKGNSYPRPDWRPQTKFERRGLEEGHKINDFYFKKIN